MECRLYVAKSALIGTPRFFPKLHHAVVIEVQRPTSVSLQLFDVIPENPTSLETVVSMIRGESVPATPRCRHVSMTRLSTTHVFDCVVDSFGDGDTVLEAARMFQEDYFAGPDGPRMGLYRNNCVDFTNMLVEHVITVLENAHNE